MNQNFEHDITDCFFLSEKFKRRFDDLIDVSISPILAIYPEISPHIDEYLKVDYIKLNCVVAILLADGRMEIMKISLKVIKY